MVAVARLQGATLPAPGTLERESVIHHRIRDGVAEGVDVTNDGQPCRRIPLQVLARKGYEVSIRWECAPPLRNLSIHFGFLERLGSDHRHLMDFDTGDRSGSSGGERVSATL